VALRKTLQRTKIDEQISRGVVAIPFDLARSFDAETNASLRATGFVVDAKQGLILTNRHVVTAGPVTIRSRNPFCASVEMTDGQR
jgi:S1-C subfamily serine protease